MPATRGASLIQAKLMKVHCCCFVTGKLDGTDCIAILFRKLHAECNLAWCQLFSARFSTVNPLIDLLSSSYRAETSPRIWIISENQEIAGTSGQNQRRRRLSPFHDDRYSLPAANTDGRESIPATSPTQFKQKSEKQSRSGRPKWMT